MKRNVYGYKCLQCGHINYPYRMRCRKCGKTEYTDFELVALPTKGKLLTFTRLYNLPSDYAVATLQLGIVELENGVRVMGQLHIPNPAMGMNVEAKVDVVRRTDYDNFYGMIFYPA
ncbi:MAG: OB-fold domain-containing protein [Acidobacteria bacterium]|nr:OB-fold domain-containing protein [Acidobacteriota bacterium]